MTIPAELDLSCTKIDEQSVGIEPRSSQFAALSRMTVRMLVRDAANEEAWQDPGGWLRAQLSVDTSALSETIQGVVQSPDSPVGGDTTREATDSLGGWLALLGQAPLAACSAPETRGEITEIACNFSSDGLGLRLTERLVVAGERRYAITMRAMNDQRMGHFEAIANSFDPD